MCSPVLIHKWSRYGSLGGATRGSTIQKRIGCWKCQRMQVRTIVKHCMIHVHIIDPYEDQFEKQSEARKERIAKNEYQRLRNIARAEKSGTLKGIVTRSDGLDTECHSV